MNRRPPTASDSPPQATEALRAATRPQHLRLHEHPLLIGLGGEHPQGVRLQDVLEAFYGFYIGLEPLLVNAARDAECAEYYTQPMRSTWLAEDLCALGHSLSTLAELPCCDDLPSIDGLAEFCGSLYVVEGSALGGRQISNRLESLGHRRPRFFDGCGVDTARHWKQICRFIDANCSTIARREAAARLASDTFGALERWLDRRQEAARQG